MKSPLTYPVTPPMEAPNAEAYVEQPTPASPINEFPPDVWRDPVFLESLHKKLIQEDPINGDMVFKRLLEQLPKQAPTPAPSPAPVAPPQVPTPYDVYQRLLRKQ